MCEVIFFWWMVRCHFPPSGKPSSFNLFPSINVLSMSMRRLMYDGQVLQDPIEVRHSSCITLRVSLFNLPKKDPNNWWRWAWLASNNKQLDILWRLSPKKHVYRAKIGGWSLARWALLRQWPISPTSSYSIWPHRFRHKQKSNGEAETNKFQTNS